MRRYIYIGLAALVVWLAAGCEEREWDGLDGTMPAPVIDPTQMDLSCSLVNVQGTAAQPMTRGLVGQTTTAALEGNFIQINEALADGVTPENYGPTTFTGWGAASIVNAEVVSSPDNTSDINFRSVVLSPTRTYAYRDHDNDESTDPVAGITRMVGWYPRTYEVPPGPDGKPGVGAFADSDSREVIDGKECVVFRNKLDGQTDVMVTDMREGRMQIAGFKNNSTNDYDVQPYGHLFKDYMNPSEGYQYCNYFTFNHYLTAVRLYIRVNKSDLSLIAWKQIDDVVFVDQPSTVAVELPTKQAREGTGSALVTGTTPTLPVENVTPIFGDAVEWSDPKNMPIIKTPVSDDPNYPQFGEVPSYPIAMKHAIDMEKTYLGYMMIRPDQDTEIEIHTDAGVFNATIPREVTITEADGTSQTNRILKQGWIYDIVIDMKTDGVLDVIVGNEDFESFRDLAPYNTTINDFEYANCFLIDQERMKKDDGTWYNGFYFEAMTAGRGKKGQIEGTGMDNVNFDPYRARILWQSEPSLVTNVELIHGYVRFSLHEDCRKDTDPKQGNAVIAVYDKNDNILWSWHIWVVNGVEDYTMKGLAADNTTQLPYHVMNMNLGATASSWKGSEDVLKTYGLYYQWGRKDPSPGPPTYNYGQQALTTAPYYYLDEGERDYVSRLVVPKATMSDAVLHPLDLVTSSIKNETYYNDWLNTPNDQLWGGGTGSAFGKTNYDPCPYGYRVAFDELNQIFRYAKTGSGTPAVKDSFGYRIPDSDDPQTVYNYFPFAGWKGHDRGRTDDTHAWYYVGQLGDYQDARISDGTGTYGAYYEGHRGRTLLITGNNPGAYTPQNVQPVYSENITLDYANRSSASPVRCVRYNAPDEEPSADQTDGN